jgi:hypothetical protein
MKLWYVKKDDSITMSNKVIERPQHLFMRVALGIHGNNLSKVYETYVFTTEIGTINVEVMNDTEAMTPQLYQLVNLFGEKDTAVMNGTLEIKEDTNELLQMLKSKKGGKRKRRTLKKHTKRVSRRSTRGRRVNSRRK